MSVAQSKNMSEISSTGKNFFKSLVQLERLQDHSVCPIKKSTLRVDTPSSQLFLVKEFSYQKVKIRCWMGAKKQIVPT